MIGDKVNKGGVTCWSVDTEVPLTSTSLGSDIELHQDEERQEEQRRIELSSADDGKDNTRLLKSRRLTNTRHQPRADLSRWGHVTCNRRLASRQRPLLHHSKHGCLSLIMTSLSMTVVALDRYWYIVHASRSADNPIFKHIRKVMAILWIVSIAFCIPLLFYWKQMSVFDGTNTYVFCGVLWAPTVNNSTYIVVSGVLFLGIPFTIITICYTRVFLTARAASRRVSPNVLHGPDQLRHSHSQKTDSDGVFFTRRSGLAMDHAPIADKDARWGCPSRDVAAGSGEGQVNQTFRPDNVPSPHGPASRQTLLAHTRQRRLLTLLLTSVVLFVLMLMPQCIVGALTISVPVTSTHYIIATACTVTNTCVNPSLLLYFHRDYRMAAIRRLHALCPCCSRGDGGMGTAGRL
ncbi:hypothetical protein C0Q70_05865 [Pomacea canaliculata]|uniref:G-protein coupled receptors family 1 profile domain-containing protein n=1 Tax=Pomacea canaliculata TaxID=400727 RepID=A0A2T7PME1_POMCA|nr:hypothetical protein C0Q70_05865 [Pomacea canaliculata]